jgi:PHD and RING finger domain-containing protein 1
MSDYNDKDIGRRTTRGMKRKASRRICDSSNDNSDRPSEPQRKRAKRGRTSTTVQTEGGSEEATTAEVGGATSPPSPEGVLAAPDVSGSSSDGGSEKCPICLTTLEAQEVGTPDTCDHLFCTSCLKKWSAETNTCPVDRQKFNLILVRHYPDGEIIGRMSVRPRLRQIGHEAVFLPDVRFCEVCGESNHQDIMAYCYACNFLYHPECASSLEETVTLDGWLCPLCYTISSVFQIDWGTRT